MNKITLLGTGTCQLQKNRMASSALIELNGSRYVYDFGRGVTQRLVEVGLRQDDIQHIILSHSHPDHISDLIPFLHAASWSRIDKRSSDLNIYCTADTGKTLEQLIVTFGKDAVLRGNFRLNIHHIENSKVTIGEQDFFFSELPPANNHGLKFNFNGKKYALTGDSHFHNQEISFLKNVDLSIVDLGHITEDNIVCLAVSTQAKVIVCSHIYWEADEEALNFRAKKAGYGGKIIIAEDLMSFVL